MRRKFQRVLILLCFSGFVAIGAACTSAAAPTEVSTSTPAIATPPATKVIPSNTPEEATATIGVDVTASATAPAPATTEPTAADATATVQPPEPSPTPRVVPTVPLKIPPATPTAPPQPSATAT